MWSLIWSWVKSYFETPKQAPVPNPPFNNPIPFVTTPSITTDVGAVADAIKEGGVVADDTIKALNTPAETQGRLNVAEQKIRDQNASDVDQALKTGDNRKLDEDLS